MIPGAFDGGSPMLHVDFRKFQCRPVVFRGQGQLDHLQKCSVLSLDT